MTSIAQAFTPDAVNPNLPRDTIGLRAFNLIPGAAFMLIDEPDPRVWIVQHVSRDLNHERVNVWAHDGTNASDEAAFKGSSDHLALNLDFCTLVALIGLVVNPGDPDDNDWGSND